MSDRAPSMKAQIESKVAQGWTATRIAAEVGCTLTYATYILDSVRSRGSNLFDTGDHELHLTMVFAASPGGFPYAVAHRKAA